MARVTIREAARLLGISTDTVRRRLDRGELAGEKVQQGRGELWLVEVADDLSPPEISEEAHSLRIEYLERDVERLETQLARAEEEVAYLRQMNLELLALVRSHVGRPPSYLMQRVRALVRMPVRALPGG